MWRAWRQRETGSCVYDSNYLTCDMLPHHFDESSTAAAVNLLTMSTPSRKPAETTCLNLLKATPA